MLCASPGIALQPAFWDCWRAVAQCIRPESADAVRSTSLVQLYHSHLMLQASAPAGRRDEVALPQWALDKGREHWLAASGEGVGARPGPKSLELQASIAGAFDAIGLRPRLDVTTEDKLFRVDLAIRLQDGTKLAVCIDGPLQFCRNTGRKLGTAYARDRLLEVGRGGILLQGSSWICERLAVCLVVPSAGIMTCTVLFPVLHCFCLAGPWVGGPEHSRVGLGAAQGAQQAGQVPEGAAGAPRAAVTGGVR